MKTLEPHRHSRSITGFRIACTTAILLASLHCLAADPWWQPATSTVKPITAWQATDALDKPLKMELSAVNGETALVSNQKPVKLTSPTKVAANSEVTIFFTLNPPAKKPASLKVNIAEDGAPGLPVTITTTGGTDTITINAAGVPATFHAQGNYKRSLAWPENVRKIVESEMASLPAVSERQFSLRYILRKDTFEIYFNDILVTARQIVAAVPVAAGAPPAKPRKPSEAPTSIGGPLTLTLPAFVNVLGVQTRTLGAEPPIFEAIHIDGRLNAARIDGAAVKEESLPNRGEPTLVNGKPFVFPRRDARGNDHIDVGASWMQNGALEGSFSPHHDPVGGRWAGPLVENPTRIQFHVPKGRYRALHLIAAADSDKDSAPVLTVQFFRPQAGRPESFPGRVPLLTAKSTDAVPLPIQLDNGKSANLWLVTVPIEPGALAAFDDLDVYGMEITKEVQLYRAYPDPLEYSAHAAGLPSAVHVYAMTLERPAVMLDLQPDMLGHLFTMPAKPSYTVKLRNISGKPHPVSLEITTISHDGASKSTQQSNVAVSVAGGTAKFALKLERYGYHDVILTMKDGDSVWTEKRSLGWLQADTRAKRDWEPGRGPTFGFWDWAGGHVTPPHPVQLELMGKLGAEWVNGSISQTDEEGRATAEKFGIFSLVQGAHSHFYTAEVGKKLDDPAAAKEWLLEQFRKHEVKPSAIERPDNLSFFAEPQLGQITTGIPPDYYGEQYTFTKDEEERYQKAERAFLFGAKIAKEFWPNVKRQFPYGDPLYSVWFMRRSKEVRELMDGINVDIPVFDRMAENQIHQVSIHRCYVMQEELKKAGIKNPNLVMVEGPCLPTRPGALSMNEQADNWVRLSLLLYAYGIDRQIGGWGIECAGYWGEQHYGGGVYNQIPFVTPKPSACALATMTRHTNRKNFTKWLPTGSLTAFAMQYKHYKTGEQTHIFWTARGKRPVTLTVPADAKIIHVDQMDNETPLTVKDGQVTFTISTSPCYIEGLAIDPAISLGAADHSDSRPAADAVMLGNLGGWKLSKEEDATYAKNSPLQIHRFPGVMTTEDVTIPAEQGGKAIAVHLGQQTKQQKIMPYYTTLVPPKPIKIAGKASHIGLWVNAHSDWGRVVYSLRDSKGERWISIGTFSDWNCDDPKSMSYFNFDGWRYLRFEMPSNAPYDRYREMGSSWWGHFGEGDGQVDLPLTLEKVIVERRTHAMYVNDPQPANTEDVQLGNLLVEYAKPADKTEVVVRLDKIRMPVPTTIPDLGNPIKEFADTGLGAPVKIERITVPQQDADGTRCSIHFKAIEGATAYDIWVSPYADGRGALQLGKTWKEPGQQIVGLRPDTDFYVFALYTDKDGKASKPSEGFKIHLKNIFGMK